MAARFLLNLIARIVPLSIAFLFTVYSDNADTKILAYMGGIMILVVAEYIGNFRPLVNLEEHKRKVLDYYFKSFVESAAIGDKKVKVRVNVMLAKWSWIGRKFFQFYQCGMAGHADANFTFGINRGFCGQVFCTNTHKVHFIDLRDYSKEKSKAEFRLTNNQIRKTSELKAIACIPLYREVKTLRGNMKTKFYGVLNVDTFEDNGVEFLKTKAIQEQIEALAGFVQLTLN